MATIQSTPTLLTNWSLAVSSALVTFAAECMPSLASNYSLHVLVTLVCVHSHRNANSSIISVIRRDDMQIYRETITTLLFHVKLILFLYQTGNQRLITEYLLLPYELLKNILFSTSLNITSHLTSLKLTSMHANISHK